MATRIHSLVGLADRLLLDVDSLADVLEHVVVSLLAHLGHDHEKRDTCDGLRLLAFLLVELHKVFCRNLGCFQDVRRQVELYTGFCNDVWGFDAHIDGSENRRAGLFVALAHFLFVRVPAVTQNLVHVRGFVSKATSHVHAESRLGFQTFALQLATGLDFLKELLGPSNDFRVFLEVQGFCQVMQLFATFVDIFLGSRNLWEVDFAQLTRNLARARDEGVGD